MKESEFNKRQIPPRYKGIYDKAMRGRSPKSAMQAFCLECVGWVKDEVTKCTDPECPLYPYRPYQKVPWKRQRGIKGDVQGRFKTQTRPKLLIR